jgi:RNA polymerase sigma factor (sigma-70 family)
MEASSLKQTALHTRPAPGPLLRLASDERLITLIRRGHHAAFEALVQRYQSRLLAFCRHMLGSREDAEDVLQDVFAAAFNAILADERDINVRPWLYRIARNRSLNHLRRASAVGMDSMDTYFADHGQSVPERILQRESFRDLVDDIGHLAETQRTALLLREIDALSYEQIAEVMDTTVPSVKSLLVRARVSLAEAAEARQLSCEEVREELGEVAEGLVRISPPVRRHVRECERCRGFNKQLKRNERALAALLPVGGLWALLHRLVATKLSGGAYAAGSGGASAGTGAGIAAGAGAASGISGVSGVAGLGGGAIAAKAVAGLAAAALLTAGAVEVGHSAHHARAAGGPHAAVVSSNHGADAAPSVVSWAPQALTAAHAPAATTSHVAKKASSAATKHPHAAVTSNAAARAASTAAAAGAGIKPTKAHDSTIPASQVVQVTSSTTQPTTASTGAPAAPAPTATAPQPAQPPATPEASGGQTGGTGPTGATGEAPQGAAEAPTGTTTEATGGTEAPPGAAEGAPAS